MCKELEDIVNIANGIYQEAFYANCCFDLIKQYRKNVKTYKKEMGISSTFYNITYCALQDACIMALARIYDKHSSSCNIDYLWNRCNKNKHLFPEKNVGKISDEIGNKKAFDIPFLHKYSKEEIDLIRKSNKIFSNNIKNKIKNDTISCDELNGIYIETTKDDYFILYSLIRKNIQEEEKYLKEQRDKIYAHNDKQVNFNAETILSQYPLDDEKIGNLIKVALDISIFVISTLSKIKKSEKYENIGDWENTLKLISKK